MLGVHLREAKHLAVRQLPADFLTHFLQIGDFLCAQRQTFLLVVGFQILDIDNRVWLLVNRKDILVQPVVNALEHRVMCCLARRYREVFLDTADALQSHVLGNFHGVRTPRRNHFAARTDEPSAQCLSLYRLGSAKKPYELLRLFRCKRMLGLYRQHRFCRRLKE